MQLIVFIGLQGCGKSTFYQRKFADTHLRMNMDMLKTRYREQLLFEACLGAKQPIVIDNTNPTLVDRARYVAPAKAHGFEIIGYYFQSRLEECKRRNAERPEDQVVPLLGVLGTYNRLMLPTRDEGFDRLYYVKIDEAGQFGIEECPMKFDELDEQMRVFETAHDYCVLPGIYIVARLDGRGFTRLTKDVHQFEAPFDIRFRDLMLGTAEALMTEFNAVYAFTQSDEISLLFPLNCNLFNRKLRKLNSVLAGFASARFALDLGSMASLDCRICELPMTRHVIDYFRWRNEDAHRNALNAHCYWLLRKEGQSANEAGQALLRLSVAEKNELLFQRGANFNEFPNWQKRGMGLYWEEHDKEGLNPVTGEKVLAKRRRIKSDLELPMKEAYSDS